MTDATALPTTTAEPTHVAVTGIQRLWRRELDHYPPTRTRHRMLLLVVVSSVVMY